MISKQQYNSDLAKGIQYFLDINEIGYACEDLLNQDHFWDINHMPFMDRYTLAHEIISKMPDGIDELSREARPYTESVAFLLMSIPYEPLALEEENTAFSLASMFHGLDISNQYSLSEKLEICRAVAQLYCEIYGLNTDVPIGTVWIRDDASNKTKDYFNHVAAFYTPYEICDLKKKYECESDLEDHIVQSVLMNRDEFIKLSTSDMLVWLTHELRHVLQREKPTIQVQQQQQQSISSRVNNKMHKAIYFTLMEERQAYAFDGWLADHLKGNMKRTELQITCDHLWFKGGLSGNIINAIYDFHHHTTEPIPQKIFGEVGFTPHPA